MAGNGPLDPKGYDSDASGNLDGCAPEDLGPGSVGGPLHENTDENTGQVRIGSIGTDILDVRDSDCGMDGTCGQVGSESLLGKELDDEPLRFDGDSPAHGAMVDSQDGQNGYSTAAIAGAEGLDVELPELPDLPFLEGEKTPGDDDVPAVSAVSEHVDPSSAPPAAHIWTQQTAHRSDMNPFDTESPGSPSTASVGAISSSEANACELGDNALADGPHNADDDAWNADASAGDRDTPQGEVPPDSIDALHAEPGAIQVDRQWMDDLSDPSPTASSSRAQYAPARPEEAPASQIMATASGQLTELNTDEAADHSSLSTSHEPLAAAFSELADSAKDGPTSELAKFIPDDLGSFNEPLPAHDSPPSNDVDGSDEQDVAVAEAHETHSKALRSSERRELDDDQEQHPRTASAPPSLTPLPLKAPPPAGERTWLTQYPMFKTRSQQLARIGDWRELAAITGHALLHSPYAERMTRTGMLLDLARIYRDRLRDQTRAEEAFAVLAQEDPSCAEAIDYLISNFRQRGNWESVYELYISAIEATWDPNGRLSWTQQAADVATNQLRDEGLAIKAWEHLWRLGDALKEVTLELSRLYRREGRWAQLADFLQQQANGCQGPEKLVILRELVEVRLVGLQDADGASEVLQEIVDLRPDDPIAILQLARVNAQRQDWDSLIQLWQQQASTEEVPGDRTLDLLHLVADSLWQAGLREQAIEAYDRILLADSTHAVSILRKQEFLTQSGRYEDLIQLLVDRADSAVEDAQRCELLTQAAALAEHELNDEAMAVELWGNRVALDPDYQPAYEALSRLHETRDNIEALAQSLEGELRLSRDGDARVKLLRRLGAHYTLRLSQDDKAKACWEEILALKPGDREARLELITLHRRRGDFEALNSVLQRQIGLIKDADQTKELCRMAAENLDQNFEDPERSVHAWYRMLDHAPRDVAALGALKPHLAGTGRRLQLIANCEREIRASQSIETRIQLSLEVAKLWEAESDFRGAAACYERVLAWNPTHTDALQAAVDIYVNKGESGKAIGLLEHASSQLGTTTDRVALLRKCLDLHPVNDHARRFFVLRRIMLLSKDWSREPLDELRTEADAHEGTRLWHELAAMLLHISSLTADAEDRLPLDAELAEIFETRLQDSARAYLARQGTLLSPERYQASAAEIARLALDTGRHEDHLAVLQRLTTTDFELAERKRAILQRANICEHHLENPVRAFHETRRLLELDPSDREPLESLRGLAEAHDMWGQFDAVLAELWDTSPTTEERITLVKHREQVARTQLKDPAAAFELLLRCYRLTPDDQSLTKKLAEDARALGSWGWLLPVLEGIQLSRDDDQSVAERVVTAEHYAKTLEQPNRAMALYASAFTEAPQRHDLAQQLQSLTNQTGHHETLAVIFREAAATTGDVDQTADLLRLVTQIYEQDLDAEVLALDQHLRLLDIREDEVPSLEKVIDWNRNQEQWRDLRDRLEQWVRVAPPDEDRTPQRMEIGQLCEQRLDEPEQALNTYSAILADNPGHAPAHEALKSLVATVTDPATRISWIEMELADATPERAIQLRLEIADLQEEQLEDRDAAIETLRQVVSQVGPNGAGFESLRRLLLEAGCWKDLVLLLQQASEQLEPDQERLAALDAAMAIYHEHLAADEPKLGERLNRALLALRPGDVAVQIQLSCQLRQQGRFQELSELLEQMLQHQGNSVDPTATLFELARINAHNLQNLDRAKDMWQRVLDKNSADEGAILGLAWAAQQEGNIEAYLDYRKRQAELLSPEDGALILCHLAEVCDENESLASRKINLYREARSMDPQNQPAMEALKGIGRRLTNLRPGAALLPLEGERELRPEERALRLHALAVEALPNDADQSMEWYRRAAAMAPDAPEHWAALADLYAARRDMAASYRARVSWHRALERCQPLQGDQLTTEAQRLYDLASSALEAGEQEAYVAGVRRAYQLVPSHAPSALAAARSMVDAGEFVAAHRLLHTILTQHNEELNDEQRVHSLFSRGLTRQALGDTEQAAADLRAALQINPLHAEALMTLGELYAADGRITAALEHHIRALTVTEHIPARSQQYHRIGVLWEDGLGAYEEAGACFETALASGMADNRDLLHRTLRHLQRTGRLEQSLDVVDGLLPFSTDPDELATLWLVRGEIFAARDSQENEAIEAFDMALSYDPGRKAALDGLTAVLEQRGDWQQFLQVLESTLDATSPSQQGQALLRMAQICNDKLADEQRAETYLRRSVEMTPTLEALEQLEQIYARGSGRDQDRREILGQLVQLGPPWMHRSIELARLLLGEQDAWAWCMLSPLLGVSQIDSELKSLVQSMRKAHDRPPLLCPDAEQEHLLTHPDACPRLTHVLAELGEIVKPPGTDSIDQVGDGHAMAIGSNTHIGKLFSAMSERMGLTDCRLYRTQNLDEPVQIVDGTSEIAVVVRTEIVQQLVHAEVGFFFAYALSLAKPGYRMMAAMPAGLRGLLLQGLWAALGYGRGTSAAADELGQQIQSKAGDSLIEQWAQQLSALRDGDPLETAGRYWNGVCATSRRAGLVAGADLRQVFRVISRLDDTVQRPRVVARIDDLDEYIASCAMLVDLVGYAASSAFGELLRITSIPAE